MRRFDYINKRIREGNYKSYLEIGVDKGGNFIKVVCDKKIGVDPKCLYENVIKKTSDAFFKSNQETFDIIFIDGLHTAEQVEKDIVNSMNCLSQGGVIILHDINPPTEESQRVPKASIPWKGTVWRAMVGFIQMYGHGYTLSKADTGLGVIDYLPGVKTGFITNMDYQDFDKDRYRHLNIVD